MATQPPDSTTTQSHHEPQVSATATSSNVRSEQTRPSDTKPQPQNATQPKPSHKPFPSITGSCMCSLIRYRLLTSPLFVYACHCTDCQKTSGTAFATFLNIETYNIALLTPTPPVLITQVKRPGLVNKHVECPKCHVQLWSQSWLGPGIAEVRVGTLDFAGLFEPDVHSFVESKVGWLELPKNARTSKRDFNHRDMWPKSSLKRLEICLARVAKVEEERKKKLEEVVQAHVPGEVTVDRPVVATPEMLGVAEKEEGSGDGEKTPTAAGDVAEDAEGETDEAFEKRYRETERVLQARLEKLSQKLRDEEKQKQEDLEKLTANLEISDTKAAGKSGE